ncbi:unnamed protein product [Blepharisma stoltei]|uniref:Uncharacterized protein n=1 Tax=Blepharisma stoltei TaxID=1481888 RepID=A0AAU9IJ57_9CILI|nr:unnamed protein product [Blepharisma stoltei]
MESFRTQLVGISAFPMLENQIVNSKTQALLRKSNQGLIIASTNPSNLVEPTRLGERFAPDSCVEGGNLKYVWGNGLIENTHRPTELYQLEKTQEEASNDYVNNDYPKIKMVIPQLIVRERPGITTLSLRSQTVPANYFSNDEIVEEEPKSKTIEVSMPTAKNLSTSQNSSSLRSSSNNKSRSSLSKTSKSNSQLSSSSRQEKSSLIPTKKRPKKSKKAILKKTEKEVPSIAIPEASPDNPSSLSASASRKTVTWSEPYSDNRDTIKEEYEEKRKQLFENHKKYPSYFKEKDPHKDSIEKLEKIISEQNTLVKSLDSGLSASSQSSKYQKTYEELEKEIESIKELLNEREEKFKSSSSYNSKEEEEISDLSYSSDEPRKEEFEDWLSPRFPEDKP